MADVDFSYIVSSLPAYVKDNGDVIGRAIIGGTSSVKHLTPMTDVKYKAMLNPLTLSGDFQNGAGCATEYNATATISKREIVTAILEKKWRICPDTLLGKYGEYLVRIPADKRDSLPFEAFLVAEIIDNVNEELDTLAWQGSVSGGDLIDGFLTIAAADITAGTAKAETIAAGSKALAAIEQVIAALPGKVQRKCSVYVGPEFFTKACFELVNANLYHFNPGTPVDSFILPGTNVEVISASGLEGSKKIVASPKQNMFYGTDEAEAQNRVKLGFNDEKGYFYAISRFNFGVQYAFPDWVCVGTYTTLG